MKDLKEHITESLLDDFDDIADKIQTNPFKSILDAKNVKEFDSAVENLISMCEKVESSIQLLDKKSFFLSKIRFMCGKPTGIVIDKVLKKSAKAMTIRPRDFSSFEVKWVYYAKEKIEPLTTNFLSGGNFDTYYYTSIYKLPKHIEKCYLDIVSKLKPGKDVFLDKGFGREILSGERLVKKIS
jgi:hypothetical protein